MYRPGLSPSVRNFTASIKSGESVGVCGRTASGKSSLFVMLLRLQGVLSKGRILIGGRGIEQMPLAYLRGELITVIPQDPVLFSGTIRQNVDIFGRFGDSEVLRALGRAQLLGKLGGGGGATGEEEGAAGSNGEESGTRKESWSTQQILATPVTSGGQNWSAGERQLICFARAILSSSTTSSSTGAKKILLMDEATATIDHATDSKIQQVLRTDPAFRGITKIIIAHRLGTIADCDTIWVMQDGNLAECGSPGALMAKEGGLFRGLRAAEERD